ncbi:competence protein ComFB [Paenisporosarcina cavernae]|uniref:Competence protein ComFB n=2 Tax=Paenisporosarcina cavernae TaxID=2320858 RepID=A0A385YZQ1_9BACL|nr:competence protein ComFB [Paenisporosarcina cavernae]
MEEIVRSLVMVLMRGSEYQMICKCPKCEADIMALTLNSVPSHYVTSSFGREAAYEQLNTKENLEWINKRIIRAIHVVSKYPKH